MNKVLSQDVLDHPKNNDERIVSAVRDGFSVLLTPPPLPEGETTRAVAIVPPMQGFGWEYLDVNISDEVIETAKELQNVVHSVAFEAEWFLYHAIRRILELLHKGMFAPTVQEKFFREEDGIRYYSELMFNGERNEVGAIRFTLIQNLFFGADTYDFYVHPDIVSIPRSKIREWDGVQNMPSANRVITF
ncbi:MAG: hypothetical protein H9W81_18425 [Enterococcus sp.]|nr:hypothetical protein [Enterococcus sp.]